MATETAERLGTGVDGLDAILGGGLVTGGIYIVSGRPGAGKTILSNQIAFAHAKRGGRAVYATLLAETHERLLSQLRTLSYFEPDRVGTDVVYLNGLKAMVDGGLPELLSLVRRMVRDHGASLLVLDGMVTAAALAPSPLDYKRFISELQTWVSVVGCTVLLVTSVGPDAPVSPEHTMVDGIIELSTEGVKMRAMRRLRVTKLRGSAFVEGAHSYLITADGMRVWPRFEARPMPEPDPEVARRGERVPTGIPGLDALVGGGLVRGSSTLVLAPSGCGKSVLGLQFLAEGARRGEPSLYFGFFEPVPLVIAKGERLGFGLTKAMENGGLFVAWRRASEIFLDAVADELLALVRRHRIRRLFFDGFAALHAAAEPDRVSAVFATLTTGLVAEGVTMIISDETRELFVQDVSVPTPFVSALFHNILFMRRIETPDRRLETTIVTMKTRDAGHDDRIWRCAIRDDGLTLVAPLVPGKKTSRSPKGKRRTR